MNKELWNSLSSEEKTNAVRHFLEKNDLLNFDYDKCKADYERIMKELGDKSWAYFCRFKNPVIELMECDPVLSYMVYSLLFTTYEYKLPNGGTKKDTIPILGFDVVAIHNDKASLMNFSDSEKQVLKEALHILKSKVEADEGE